MAEPKHAAGPLGVDETAGRKVYCTCGWSAKLPYCDGAHNRMQTGCQPSVCELAGPGRKWICQCHRSGSLPWCDGTHKELAGLSAQQG